MQDIKDNMFTEKVEPQSNFNNHIDSKYKKSYRNISSKSTGTYQAKLKFPVGELRDLRFEGIPSCEMEITFLGTASCHPSITRGVSSTCLRYNSDIFLFDCGESTQLQLQKSRIRPSKIRKIFISHTHGDHFFGISGILCHLGKAALEEHCIETSNEEVIVDIYGPEGVRDYIRTTLQISHSAIAIPHRIHELKNVPYFNGKSFKKFQYRSLNTRLDRRFGEREGSLDIYPTNDGIYEIGSCGELRVVAAPMQHVVPCVGYVIQEESRQGSLNIDFVSNLIESNKVELAKLADNRGDYKKTFRTLKSLGPTDKFIFPSGDIVFGKDVNQPSKKGRKIAILGDTSSASLIRDVAMDADIVIHEATNAFFPDTDYSKYMNYKDLETETISHGHSTPQMAGRFASAVNAKKLILNHFSPRYSGDNSESSMRKMWMIEDMARETSNLSVPNDVIAAWDFMSLPIPLR